MDYLRRVRRANASALFMIATVWCLVAWVALCVLGFFLPAIVLGAMNPEALTFASWLVLMFAMFFAGIFHVVLVSVLQVILTDPEFLGNESR